MILRSVTALTLLAATACAEPAEFTDLAPWVQQQLDEHSRCEIPAGVYYLDSPITLPRRSNVRLIGAGKGDPNLATKGRRFRGDATWLIYRGPADETAVTLTGSEYHAEGMNFYTQDADLGLLITKRGKGLGSGGEIRNCSWSGFKTCAQIGETPGMHNCDNTHWYRCDFHGAEVAVRQVNSQAMLHVFDQCKLYTDRSFEIDGGGSMFIVRCTSFRGPLLTFTGRSPRKFRTGPNNADIVVADLKVDAQHNGTFRLLGDCAPNGAHVRVVRGRVSGSKSWAYGEPAVGMRLTIDGLGWNTAPTDKG